MLTLLFRVNVYTGVSFIHVPRPDSFDVSVLEPNFLAWRRALNEIMAMFRAFSRFSKKFRVNYCDIRPVFGDFRITHVLTDEDSFVEAKSLHCRIVQVANTGSLLLQHSQTSLSSSNRAVFTWRSQWDYLYTHISSDLGPKQAFFVPRDKIPKSW